MMRDWNRLFFCVVCVGCAIGGFDGENICFEVGGKEVAVDSVTAQWLKLAAIVSGLFPLGKFYFETELDNEYAEYRIFR